MFMDIYVNKCNKFSCKVKDSGLYRAFAK